MIARAVKWKAVDGVRAATLANRCRFLRNCRLANALMSNIFETLARELPEVEKQTKGIRQMSEHAMCARLLCLCFGWDWYQQRIAFQDDPDEWMQNLKHDPDPLRRIIYDSRVIRLGDAAYTLLKGQFTGADAWRHRFLTRPTKPCFAETEIASLFAYNGFNVEVVTETGVRGQDFDLAATRDGVTLSVEITAKEDGPLTVETVRNTLTTKRTQVPADRPAVLYMRIPEEWMRNPIESQAIFSEAYVEFFKKSHRFNAVVLVWEKLVPAVDGAFTGMSMWPCYNNSPRNPYSRLDLLGPTRAPDGRVLLAHSFYDFLKGVEATLLKNSAPI